MLLVTDSLVRKGWFDVDQHITITDATISLLAERSGPDGHNYLKFGLPTSLAAVPLYLIGMSVPDLGAVQTAFAFNAFITAITGALIVAIVIRLGYELIVAAASGLVFGLVTMAGVYGRFFGSEPLVGLALLLALWGLLRFRQRKHWLAAAWTGYALGLAVATHPAPAVVVPFFVWMFFGYWRLEIRDWKLRNLRSPISFFCRCRSVVYPDLSLQLRPFWVCTR